MPLLRKLLLVLVSLALVANGGGLGAAAARGGDAATGAVQSAAMPPGHAMHAMGKASCHDAADPAPAPASGDCCDSGTCACACVNHAPPALFFAGLAVPEFPATVRLSAGRRSMPPAVPASPAFRPPIA